MLCSASASFPGPTVLFPLEGIVLSSKRKVAKGQESVVRVLAVEMTACDFCQDQQNSLDTIVAAQHGIELELSADLIPRLSSLAQGGAFEPIIESLPGHYACRRRRDISQGNVVNLGVGMRQCRVRASNVDQLW